MLKTTPKPVDEAERRSGRIIGIPGLEGAVLINGQGKMVELSLVLTGPALEEYKLALNKVLNCWPDAPKWLFEISDALNGVPAPARRPETA